MSALTDHIDRRTAEAEVLNTNNEVAVARAAEEHRELNADEVAAIERDSAAMAAIQADIDRALNAQTAMDRVRETQARVSRQSPLQRVTVTERPADPADVLRDAFPTLGDYMVTVSRALSGDTAAIERIERATADQTTADNPGLIPRPILGPVINLMDTTRPFIASITNRPLPKEGNFDRPVITQHVAIGVQAAEKTETASRKMLIGKLPVVAQTFAGHVDISRQDIRRTTPAIMQIIAEDFAVQYALETDNSAANEFVASVTGAPIMVTTWTASDILAAIFQGAQVPLAAHEAVALPNTLWVSPDVWGGLGGVVSPNGAAIFPSLTPESSTGNVLGLKLVVDPFFPVNTAILGSSRLAEWYEDVDGLLQVADVPLYGQTVGYAGDGAFLNTAPASFVPLTFPITAGAPEAASSKSSK